jgi:hypothetical protein
VTPKSEENSNWFFDNVLFGIDGGATKSLASNSAGTDAKCPMCEKMSAGFDGSEEIADEVARVKGKGPCNVDIPSDETVCCIMG